MMVRQPARSDARLRDTKEKTVITIVRRQLPRQLQELLSIGVYVGPTLDRAVAIFAMPDGRRWTCDLLPDPEVGVVPSVVPDIMKTTLCLEV